MSRGSSRTCARPLICVDEQLCGSLGHTSLSCMERAGARRRMLRSAWTATCRVFHFLTLVSTPRAFLSALGLAARPSRTLQSPWIAKLDALLGTQGVKAHPYAGRYGAWLQDPSRRHSAFDYFVCLHFRTSERLLHAQGMCSRYGHLLQTSRLAEHAQGAFSNKSGE